MSSVSRLRSAPRMVDGPVASAESTRARFVIDLEPGTLMAASMGWLGVGAAHSGG